MLKIKKTFSVLLIFTLIMGMSASAFANKSRAVLMNDISIEEYDELITLMLESASNVAIEEKTSINIPVKSGRLSGTVTIKEEPLLDNNRGIVPYDSKVYHDIPDGKRVITTTLKADKILGGEMVLKSYYTMKNKGTAITATSTKASFSPPKGYTNGGTSSYITTNTSKRFVTKGSYTMKLGSKIPLTIRVVNDAQLIPTTSSHIILSYYREW